MRNHCTDMLTARDYGCILYKVKLCKVCHRPMVDLPEMPNVCEEHDMSVHVTYGLPEQVGEVEEYIAADVQMVGLFAAVVNRYVKYKKSIYKTPKFESWIDPDTGEKMGRRTLV